jgi:hypothetical protein
MPRRFILPSRPRLLILLSFAAAAPALVAALLALDWWFCLPEGAAAHYVPPQGGRVVGRF